MRVQKSIEANVPANKVWPFFVEPEKIMQWCITFKKFEYTSDQQAVLEPLFTLRNKRWASNENEV